MDHTLLLFFNQTLACPLLDVLMVGLTYGLWLLPGLGVTLWAKQRRVGRAILVSLAAGWVLTMFFQFLVMRPRPEAVRLVLPMPGFPSYPSGHAVAVFGAATVLILAYRPHRWRWAAPVAAGSISLSRVYLGHHYPSDILGGAVLGAAVGAASYGALAAQRPGRAAWRWMLWPQVAVVLMATQMAYLDILPARLLRWPLADTLLHFLLFGAVAFWLNVWLEGRRVKLGPWPLPLAILIPFAAALAEEGLQSFSPMRTASLTDVLSDLAGMFFFWQVSEALWRNRVVTCRDAPTGRLYSTDGK